MDIIFFVYGMSFLVMGIAILLQPKAHSALRLADSLWLLGIFGLVHGFSEMLDLWALHHAPGALPDAARWLVLTASFVFLFEFGRRLNGEDLPPWARRSARWYAPAAVAAAALCALSSADDSAARGLALSRYFLGLPGGLLAGAGLIRYKRREENLRQDHPAVKYFDWAGGAFLCYCVLAGAVVGPAPFFPANWLNAETFRAATGVPVQLLRAACAVVAAYGLIRVLSIFDEEAREALARALAAKKEQLQQSQKVELIGRMSAGVVHDLNNILTSVLGSCEILRAAPLDDGGKTEVQAIEEAARRAQALARQILIFTRRPSGEVRRVDLNAVVAGLDNMLRRLLGARYSVEIRPSGEGAFIEADPSRVEQILLNLAINARDAMPDGGKLKIGVDLVALPAGRRVLLTVADAGAGISPDALPRLFEPFFTTKPAGKGTGLGLYVVHEIVTQYGGAIEVDSRPGNGATFKVYFPEAA